MRHFSPRFTHSPKMFISCTRNTLFLNRRFQMVVSCTRDATFFEKHAFYLRQTSLLWPSKRLPWFFCHVNMSAKSGPRQKYSFYAGKNIIFVWGRSLYGDPWIKTLVSSTRNGTFISKWPFRCRRPCLLNGPDDRFELRAWLVEPWINITLSGWSLFV